MFWRIFWKKPVMVNRKSIVEQLVIEKLDQLLSEKKRLEDRIVNTELEIVRYKDYLKDCEKQIEEINNTKISKKNIVDNLEDFLREDK